MKMRMILILHLQQFEKEYCCGSSQRFDKDGTQGDQKWQKEAHNFTDRLLHSHR